VPLPLPLQAAEASARRIEVAGRDEGNDLSVFGEMVGEEVRDAGPAVSLNRRWKDSVSGWRHSRGSTRCVSGCAAGLRPGEVRALNVGDYRPEDRVLVVAYAMKGEHSDAPRRSPKKRRWRLDQVETELAAWIAAHRDKVFPSEPLFQNPGGRTADRRWTGPSLRQAWNAGARAAGIPVRMYEGTKHSSASAAARRGVRLEVLRRCCDLSAG
jgi:hypothetical protein